MVQTEYELVRLKSPVGNVENPIAALEEVLDELSESVEVRSAKTWHSDKRGVDMVRVAMDFSAEGIVTENEITEAVAEKFSVENDEVVLKNK